MLRNSSIFRLFLLPCMWFLSFQASFRLHFHCAHRWKLAWKWKEPHTGRKEWSEYATIAEHKLYVWCEPWDNCNHIANIYQCLHWGRQRCGFHMLFSSVQSVKLAICKFYEESHDFWFQISRGSSIPGKMSNTGIHGHFRKLHKDIFLAENPQHEDVYYL